MPLVDRHREATHTAKGFTLLELSIVLVIVALIVGGIAGLRTYTRNAALTTLMNEAKYYTNAFGQFQTRYNAPPGDYPSASLAWTGAGDGDGNGLIRATGTAPGNQAEWFYTFQHLALAGFISGTFTGATAGGVGTFYAQAGTNVPGSSFNEAAFLFDNPGAGSTVVDGFISGSGYYFDGQYPNVIVVAGLAANATDIPNQAVFTPKQAYQLDDKYDDGMPGQGNIVTPKNAALSNCANSDTASSAAYTMAYEDKACLLIMKMQ